MRNRIVLLAVVIGLLVGAAGIGLLVVTDEDDGTSVVADLPKLPMGASGERTMAAGTAADMMLAGPVEWRVRGELPDLDDHATAYRVDQRATEATVSKLARALGLNGRPSQSAEGWAVVDGDRRLFVGHGSWNYGADANCGPGERGAPDMAVSCASGSVSSPVAPCPPDVKCEPPAPPPPPADLPSKDDARGIALRTFDAAGIDASGHVEIFGPGEAWEGRAEPEIGGPRGSGAGNHLHVGPKGTNLRGRGQLIAGDGTGA